MVVCSFSFDAIMVGVAGMLDTEDAVDGIPLVRGGGRVRYDGDKPGGTWGSTRGSAVARRPRAASSRRRRRLLLVDVFRFLRSLVTNDPGKDIFTSVERISC